MPYELEQIEQKAVYTILNKLKYLKAQHLRNYHMYSDSTLKLSKISHAERIIYTSLFYYKVNEHTIKNICLDLHLLIKNKCSYHKITIQLFYAFDTLCKRSYDAVRGLWLINILKSYIFNSDLLYNHNNYEISIINQIIAEIVDETRKLKKQQYVLHCLSYSQFNEIHYQNVINNYFNLIEKINNLNADLISKYNLLNKKVNIMRFTYNEVVMAYKSVEIFHKLILVNKDIFLIYSKIVMRPLEINEDELIKLEFYQDSSNDSGIKNEPIDKINTNAVANVNIGANADANAAVNVNAAAGTNANVNAAGANNNAGADDDCIKNCFIQGDPIQGFVIESLLGQNSYNQFDFIFPDEIYLAQQKKYIIYLYEELYNCNCNSSYLAAAKKKIIYFNKYYNKCKIILDINRLNLQLQQKISILLNDNYKCLHKNSYDYLIKSYQILLSKKTLLIEPDQVKNDILLKKFDQLIENYQTIDNIYQTRSSQFFLLNSKQEKFVNLYFKYNPFINKISKKITQINLDEQPQEIVQLINQYSNILPLSYSIIRDPLTNKLFVILPSKKNYIILRNGSLVLIEGLIGTGIYGKVKLAQALDDFSIIVVKIQISTDSKPISGSSIYNEEKIQTLLNQFVASSRVYNYTNLKYYTFSKYIYGKNVYEYLCKKKKLHIDEILIIFIQILNKVEFLHKKMRIVHGDLSFCNILYDSVTKSLEIIDFGFSGVADENDMIRFPSLSAIRKTYIAEECYIYKQATFASDIYTLGCWFRLCIDNYINHNKALPPIILSKCFNLISKMLNTNYVLRPDVTDCIKETSSILHDVKN